ncbi:MAG: acyl carrier protein [Steroidobacteraceae bacterium]
MNDRDKIKKFVLNNFLFTDDPSAVQDGASLIEGGIVDSTGILELIMFLDETLAVRVEDAEMVPANFESIDAIVNFVARKRAR